MNPVSRSSLLIFAIAAVALEYSGSATAQSFPGSYRPVDKSSADAKTNTSSQDTRFVTPTAPNSHDTSFPGPAHSTQMPAYPPPPIQPQPLPAYPATGYNNDTFQVPTYNFNLNPMNIMDEFFGGGKKHDSYYGYPSVTPPLYPPIPGYATPNIYQPSLAYPHNNGYTGAQDGWHDPLPPVSPQPLQAEPVNNGTGNPRPFANPQESGNSFMQRKPVLPVGGHDSRFRPPELKSTP